LSSWNSPQLCHSGFCRDDGQHGFTLLEMLVTLVVASIMLGIAAVQLMPDEQAQLREESVRLAYLLEQAGAGSRAGGQALAWSGNGNSFRFWKKNKQGEWRRVEQDALLHPRTLPDTVRIAALEIAGRAAQPGEMLLLSPESATLPFRIRMVSGERQIRIAGNGLGTVAVVQP
jgi:general secretion pathway protein H